MGALSSVTVSSVKRMMTFSHVIGGEDGGEGVCHEQFAHEQGEDGGDNDGEDDNDDWCCA